MVAEFLARADAGDRRGAMARTRELAAGGVSPEEILATIAAVQYEVGLRWQAGMWTIAQEHAATAVSEAALTALPPADPAPPGAPRVALLCGDGEWHVLPVRLFAEQLERAGAVVHFFGGSVPPEHVVQTLPTLRVDAVAVSCTLCVNLPGTARTIAAAHACGLPALVGGAAVRGRPDRVRAIAGDASPVDAAEALAYVVRWRQDGRPTPPPRHGRGEGGALLQHLDAIVSDAYSSLAAAYPAVREYEDLRMQYLREDLAHHVRYLATAAEVGDPSIYVEMVVWLTDLLLARGIPVEAVLASIDVFTRVLTVRGFKDSIGVLERARSELLAP